MKTGAAWLLVGATFIALPLSLVGASMIRFRKTDLSAIQNSNKAKPPAKAKPAAVSNSSGSTVPRRSQSATRSTGKAAAAPSTRASAPVFTGSDARESGWDLLVTDDQETEGYGLYSYFLLGCPPTNVTRELYLHAILACLEQLPNIESLKVPRSQLNIVYLPVLALPGDELIDGARMRLAGWVLRHYDYARARTLLRVFSTPHRRGPYLVSVAAPLSKATNTATQYLFQDMTFSTPDLVVLWIELFRDRTQRDRFWEETSTQAWRRYAVELRQDISIAADALAIILPAYQSVRSLLRKFLFSSP